MTAVDRNHPLWVNSPNSPRKIRDIVYGLVIRSGDTRLRRTSKAFHADTEWALWQHRVYRVHVHSQSMQPEDNKYCMHWYHAGPPSSLLVNIQKLEFRVHKCDEETRCTKKVGNKNVIDKQRQSEVVWKMAVGERRTCQVLLERNLGGTSAEKSSKDTDSVKLFDTITVTVLDQRGPWIMDLIDLNRDVSVKIAGLEGLLDYTKHHGIIIDRGSKMTVLFNGKDNYGFSQRMTREDKVPGLRV